MHITRVYESLPYVIEYKFNNMEDVNSYCILKLLASSCVGQVGSGHRKWTREHPDVRC